MPDEAMTVTIYGRETVEWIKAKVDAGQFATDSEAISECLLEMREQDLELRRWEQDVVAKRSAEYHANPSVGMTPQEVEQSLERRRRERAERAA